MLRVFYRISDCGNPKNKLPWATPNVCLTNFLQQFGDADITIVADSVRDSTWEWLCTWSRPLAQTRLGNSGSFAWCLNRALQFDDRDWVYFVEDDYLHLPGSADILIQGLDRAHYVSLYDHPDKYLSPDRGGNPKISQQGTESTQLFLTAGSHWKFTNSTTMTFAASVATLRADASVIRHFLQGSIPQDYAMFQQLLAQGRKLATPVPGWSTHVETAWLTPLRDWTTLMPEFHD